MAHSLRKNQLHEAMSIFGSMISSKWFNGKAIILFLDKFDLFQQKLPTSAFIPHFPGFRDLNQDVHAAARFVNDRFLDMNRTPGREIYTHCTTARETSLLKGPMKSAEGMIVLQNLASGLESGVI